MTSREDAARILDQVTEALNLIDGMMQGPGGFKDADGFKDLEKLDKLKGLIQGLSKRMGLGPEDSKGFGEPGTAQGRGSVGEDATTSGEAPGEARGIDSEHMQYRESGDKGPGQDAKGFAASQEILDQEVPETEESRKPEDVEETLEEVELDEEEISEEEADELEEAGELEDETESEEEEEPEEAEELEAEEELAEVADEIEEAEEEEEEIPEGEAEEIEDEEDLEEAEDEAALEEAGEDEIPEEEEDDEDQLEEIAEDLEVEQGEAEAGEGAGEEGGEGDKQNEGEYGLKYSKQGPYDIDQVTEALNLIDGMMQGPGGFKDADGFKDLEKLDKLKGLIQGLSKRMGLGPEDSKGFGEPGTAQGRGSVGEDATTSGEAPGEARGIDSEHMQYRESGDKGPGQDAKGFAASQEILDQEVPETEESRKPEDVEETLEEVELDEEEISEEEADELEEAGELEDETESEEEEEPEEAEELEAEEELAEVADEIEEAEEEEEEIPEGEAEEIEDEEDLEEAEDEAALEEAGEDEIPEEEEDDEDQLEEIAEDLEVEQGEAEAGEGAGEEGGEGDKVTGDSGAHIGEGFEEERGKEPPAKILAEKFDNYLGAIDKFYNQYVLIPKGEYIVGVKNPLREERKESKVYLESFYMGRFPVTNALFEIFVERTGYLTTAEKIGYSTVYHGRSRKTVDKGTGLKVVTLNSGLTNKVVKGACWYQPLGPGTTLHDKRNHPVVHISLEDAMAFAAWTGKRLPTEDEWETAARTANGYIYPWGNSWKEKACNIEECNTGDTEPVDKYLEFGNDSEIVDTLGNVLEWTMDPCDPPPYVKDGKSYHIVKGGSWISGNDICLFNRFKLEPFFHSNILGFRCVAY